MFHLWQRIFEKRSRCLLLSKCLTKEFETTVKSTCKEKLSSYYLEIEDNDVIARELKYHKPCLVSIHLRTTTVYEESVN